MNKWVRRSISVILLLLIGIQSVPGEYVFSKESGRQEKNTSVIVQVKSYAGEKYRKGEEIFDNMYWLPSCSQKELERLEKSSAVEFVQENYKIVKQEESDNKYIPSKQWGLRNDGSYSAGSEKNAAVAGVDIKAEQAWKAYQSQKEVVVGLIDTGVDWTHEDLQGSIWENQDEIPDNGIDDDNNGYVDDVRGWNFYKNNNILCSYNASGRAKSSDNDRHGTHCAGTIAANAENNYGVSGAASNVKAKIMIIKALGGENGDTDTVKVIKGIKYAMTNGAQLINASWGGTITESENKALKRAISCCGLLVVAAAGNEGVSNDKKPCYPASYSKELSNVVSVGSVDCTGKLSKFSNYGSSVDVLAPGGSIYSTSVGGYTTISGTSMAAPYVTAVAAMLCAEKNGCFPENLKELLMQSYTPLEGIKQEQVRCPGIIDASKAVELREQVLIDRQPPLITRLDSQYDGIISIEVEDQGASGISGVYCAYGKLSRAYFRNGARGTLITGGRASVDCSGNYTFFVIDYAGNATMDTIYVTVDKTAPKITMKKSGAKRIVQMVDAATGIKQIKYAWGKKNKSYFTKGNGQNLTLAAGTCKNYKKQKKYITFYAIDFAGNETVKTLYLG